MNILLIKPPFNPHLITKSIYEPLELEYLAAAVSQHRVRILDMRLDGKLMRTLSDFKPEVACITAYSCDMKTAKRILKEIKDFDHSIHTIVGGIHATFVPSDFEEQYIDAIFKGYGDHTFKTYVRQFDAGEDVTGIPNLGLRRDGRFVYTETQPFGVDLNSLPFPARHLIQDYQHKYHNSFRDRMSMVMTSRGCPYRCTFCACWKLMNGKYVVRDIRSIIEEIKSLPQDIEVIYFSDDNTLVNSRRAWELCDMLKEHRINKKLQMYARTSTIVKDPDLFRHLKDAGLQYLTVGLESFNDEGLLKVNKRTTVEMNNEAIRILKKAGINIFAHFLVFPEYTVNDFQQLYRYIEDKNLYKPVFPVLTPLPGTELFNETSGQLVIRDYDFYDFTHSVLPTKLDRKEFYRQLATLYFKSYALMRYVRSLISRLKWKSNLPAYHGHFDGTTFFNLLIMNIFMRPLIWKIRNAHRTEPLL